MKSFSIVGVTVLLFAVSSANESSSSTNKMKPSQWVSLLQLEQTPSIEEITLQKLENMPLEQGANMIEKLYHLSQINHNMRPTFVPSLSNIPFHIYKPNGQKVSTTLDKLALVSKQVPHLGHEEVTIYVTGLPANTETVKKANHKLVEAYLQRYNNKRVLPLKTDLSGEKLMRTSSEEDSSEWQKQEPSSGHLVVIDLGSKLNNFKRLSLLDVEQTGAMMTSAIMELIEMANLADETIHFVAQGIAAHVIGATANEYTRRTGRRFRRITALDPSKIFAKDPLTLTGLSRGDAEFVDAIHTNVYGMGTIRQVGDVDFYPNGPSTGVPGAMNTVEASMRATRYFAESVVPGNERNFPAVAANSFKEYMNNDGYGKRIYMGIDTDFDAKGDYILEVNANSPFGKRTPARKQNTYHGVHTLWKNMNDNE